MAVVLADFDTAHTGVVHDAQLDAFSQCLATASADGHVRLWDVRAPDAPAFLADLDGHGGSVHQVAWAPPAVGVLLASASADGTVVLWGRRASGPGDWQVVRREELRRHGAVQALAWAPGEHGAALACASADGTVTVLSHLGAVRTGDVSLEHKWQTQHFKAHAADGVAVSWAVAPEASTKTLGLRGARLATAGEDGVRAWCWREAAGAWEAEACSQAPLLDAAGLRVPTAPARDVAWKAWDGVAEMLASVCGRHVIFWTYEEQAAAMGEKHWKPSQAVALDEEIWKVSWAEVGSVLLVSYGLKTQRSALLKQNLAGEWDVMEVEAQDN